MIRVLLDAVPPDVRHNAVEPVQPIVAPPLSDSSIATATVTRYVQGPRSFFGCIYDVCAGLLDAHCVAQLVEYVQNIGAVQGLRPRNGGRVGRHWLPPARVEVWRAVNFAPYQRWSIPAVTVASSHSAWHDGLGQGYPDCASAVVIKPQCKATNRLLSEEYKYGQARNFDDGSY